MIAVDIKRRKYAAQGFSLIELMVVIMIMGILAATVGPAAFRWVTSGRQQSARTSLNAIAQAIDTYHAEIGSYPKQLEDLIKRPSGPQGKKWTSPYLLKEEVPVDPWDNEFVYKPTPSAEHPYDLYSYGPKGSEAPEDEYIHVWKS